MKYKFIVFVLSIAFFAFSFVHTGWYAYVCSEISSSPDKELILQDFAIALEIPSQCKEISYSKEPVFCDAVHFNWLAIPPTTAIEIVCGTGTIRIYYSDGRVEIPKGVSLPEASRVFWDAIGNAFPEFKQAIISQYEKEKE